ncbi:MAG: hypothetical protein NVSMB10_07350 [Steroidobacteraceae bacterium]
MRKLWAASLAAMSLTFAVSVSAPALADAADPTVHQIYEAAEAGHFDQAQQMMDQVLRDHPKSAKAHYVQAELFAKEGKTSLARSELGTAEQLDPGLTHENSRSVQALKSQLGMGARSAPGPRLMGAGGAPAPAHFPWGTLIIFALVIGFLWMLFRRRRAPQYATGAPMATGGAPGTYGGPGGGYGGVGPMGGGIGSGMAGGLASGLAVGAGVVAGEELAHHFMDGNHGAAGVAPPAGDEWQQPANTDMGGTDFGVNDSGSWDDSGGGGGGGGGDDWS